MPTQPQEDQHLPMNSAETLPTQASSWPPFPTDRLDLNPQLFLDRVPWACGHKAHALPSLHYEEHASGMQMHGTSSERCRSVPGARSKDAPQHIPETMALDTPPTNRGSRSLAPGNPSQVPSILKQGGQFKSQLPSWRPWLGKSLLILKGSAPPASH